MKLNWIVIIPVAMSVLFTGAVAAIGEESPVVLEPLPDKLVVLTFDDSVRSHYTVARPILKRYGFGATFFITEGFTFATNKTDYMTWDEITALERAGFEIGNHTRDHKGVSPKTIEQLEAQLAAIDQSCQAHGIEKPVSFAWPGNAFELDALPILRKHGIQWARRGGFPEYPRGGERGFPYEPGLDHPLLIPSAGIPRPGYTFEEFVETLEGARDGEVVVLQFHGVPEGEHPWVHVSRATFEQFMAYLDEHDFQVIALRDLARYVDWRVEPKEPMKIVEIRKAKLADSVVP
ncbi:MAG: polysaccharide deacetylase family protein [Opitutales bacterium]|jgi:peptidoglycan/xylan/chitin deacetylase (PgdA/CDA1 family)|nr:polysaccharide deacetylase family protein [Opitutales bacterium]MBT6379714.1 polysaccharide deacetylase family protein [Opitutales bacterium]